MPGALETWATSDVIFDARSMCAFSLGLLLHQMRRKYLLVYFDDDLKVNRQVCSNMLQGKVLPWLTETFEINYIFIQDGAQAHKAEVTKKW